VRIGSRSGGLPFDWEDPATMWAPALGGYSVVYDLRGDQISALRIYFPMSLLIEQITT
jgi:hypothetical protein